MKRISLPTMIAIAALLSLESFASAGLQINGSTLRQLGYSIKQSGDPQPTEWEKEQFNLQSKKFYRVKSVNPVPGHPDTYYRFVVTIENYASESAAEARLKRLMEKPPGLLPEEEKAFPLRAGFQCGSTVCIVNTDVYMFEQQMDRLTQKLQRFCR